MSVTVITSTKGLAAYLRNLADGDVLAFRQWRMLRAADAERPSYWLEGHGLVLKIDRDRKAAIHIRRAIETHPTARTPAP